MRVGRAEPVAGCCWIKNEREGQVKRALRLEGWTNRCEGRVSEPAFRAETET